MHALILFFDITFLNVTVQADTIIFLKSIFLF